MAGTKRNKTANFESNDYDDANNVQKDSRSDDVDIDEDINEEIVPDKGQTIIEPSPVFLPDQYDTNHLHRQHRSRDDSLMNIPKDINSTPVQVSNIFLFN